VVSALVYALLAWNTLTQLIVVYMWLRIATSVLTVLSVWRLRRTQPDLERAFRIPWGKAGMGYAVIAPLLMSVVALIGAVATSDKFALVLGPLVVILGPIAYFFCRRSS